MLVGVIYLLLASTLASAGVVWFHPGQVGTGPGDRDRSITGVFVADAEAETT
jgi:hypothetical protein